MSMAVSQVSVAYFPVYHVACRIQEITVSHVTTFLAPMSHVSKQFVACQIKELPVSPC